MRIMLIGLIGALPVAGCGAGTVPADEIDDDPQICEDCDPDEGWVLISAEDLDHNDVLDDPATLNMEFSQRESNVGQLGWHLSLGWEAGTNPSFKVTPDELQDMLASRGHNDIDVDDIKCVRWNVTYQDGWLCEGNDYTTHKADLQADTYLNWSGVAWEIETWSDPGGNGCSALACLP